MRDKQCTCKLNMDTKLIDYFLIYDFITAVYQSRPDYSKV